MSTKKDSKQAKGQAPKGAAPAKSSGPANVAKIVDNAKAAIPQDQREMFDKIILSGMRVMFDPNSREMAAQVLEQPGPLAQRLTTGVITLIYLLWQRSNQTLPPQLIVPATLVLACEAFRYVQESKDPEATSDVLGEVIAGSVQGVMDRFGATQDKLPGLLQAQKGGQAAQPQPGGLLAAATGAKA